MHQCEQLNRNFRIKNDECNLLFSSWFEETQLGLFFTGLHLDLFTANGMSSSFNSMLTYIRGHKSEVIYHKLHLSEFVWTLRSSVKEVLTIFYL